MKFLDYVCLAQKGNLPIQKKPIYPLVMTNDLPNANYAPFTSYEGKRPKIGHHHLHERHHINIKRCLM